ncbi:MAG: 4Fe-4S binding protein [Candidatus Altiarchaeota archaeon]|nr:4Fe-4S binding protein [Candidatus Altiarchaeota archaeon]
MKIKIDYDKCTSCGKCVEVCVMGALEFFEDTVVVANPEKCSCCRECEENCPTGAIHIEGKACRMH